MLLKKKKLYQKKFKGRLKKYTISNKGNKIIYGKYAIKVLKETRLTSFQIEAAKKIINKKIKKIGIMWVRVFPTIPVTLKPNENRMGKGKGSVSFFIAKVKQGQILFEITGVSLKIAKKIFEISSKKLSTKTKFIYK